MRLINKLFILLAFVSIFSACSSSVKLDDSDSVVSVNSSGTLSYDPISDPKSSVYGKRSIYFEFDSYAIDSKYASNIASHAAYLKSAKNKNISVIIQGNTDERGTAEYNLALGQKRSEAVRRSLLSQGVSESQIEAVSFGKEKPQDPAQTEAAYKENRRADFVYR